MAVYTEDASSKKKVLGGFTFQVIYWNASPQLCIMKGDIAEWLDIDFMLYPSDPDALRALRQEIKHHTGLGAREMMILILWVQDSVGDPSPLLRSEGVLWCPILLFFVLVAVAFVVPRFVLGLHGGVAALCAGIMSFLAFSLLARGNVFK
jgi:hypothetical protein